MLKPIKGFEEYYAISSEGTVISKRFNRALKPFSDRKGYLYVDLYVNGVRKRKSVHRLVAKHFVSGFKCGLVVNHKDKNIKNNSYKNLEWVTQRENILYSNARKVARLDKDTLEVLQTYESIVEATKEGFKSPEIVNCCKGNLNSHYGYKWKYV